MNFCERAYTRQASHLEANLRERICKNNVCEKYQNLSTVNLKIRQLECIFSALLLTPY